MPSSDHDILNVAYVQDSFNSFTESVEAHFELVARSLQDTFRATPWLPDSMKPSSSPSPSLSPQPLPSRLPMHVPAGYLEASRRWMSDHHRAVTAAAVAVAVIGTGAVVVWRRRRRQDRAKRRARRARNGARTEVVVLAGSAHSPLTRSLALDLERRGFIVYIPVDSVAEEQVIRQESRADVRALNVDITSPPSIDAAIQKLTRFLNSPHQAIAGSPSHKLRLSAYILLPPPAFPIGTITGINSSHWSDIVNTNLLAPIAMLNAFFPLLTSNLSSLLILTSSINPSLTPPLHAPESVVTGGLEQYVATLRRELTYINVVQMKLGHFDLGASSDERKQLALSSDFSRPELTKMRLREEVARGSPLRELHNNVFDAIVRGKGKQGTIFVGRGSRTYYLVGAWVPAGIVGWMLGYRRKAKPGLDRARSEDSVGGSAEWEKVQ